VDATNAVDLPSFTPNGTWAGRLSQRDRWPQAVPGWRAFVKAFNHAHGGGPWRAIPPRQAAGAFIFMSSEDAQCETPRSAPLCERLGFYPINLRPDIGRRPVSNSLVDLCLPQNLVRMD